MNGNIYKKIIAAITKYNQGRIMQSFEAQILISG